MSEQEESSNANEVTTMSERLIGRVKWFDNRAGYGFITVTSSGGEKNEKDVFAHHSTIVVAEEQYKYLVLGEYVSFTWCVSDSDSHEFQAGDIRGVDGGFLMCETRNEQTKNRNVDKQDDRQGQDDRRRQRRFCRRSESGRLTGQVTLEPAACSGFLFLPVSLVRYRCC